MLESWLPLAHVHADAQALRGPGLRLPCAATHLFCWFARCIVACTGSSCFPSWLCRSGCTIGVLRSTGRLSSLLSTDRCFQPLD
jgi:hypothetical protein